MKKTATPTSTETMLANDYLVKKMTRLLPALVVIYNIRNGEYIYVNDAIKHLLGYDKEQLLSGGLSFIGPLVHPDDLVRITEENARALEEANKTPNKKICATFEYRLRHKNGSWRWLHSDGVVFKRDEKGEVLYVMNVSVDITKRKEKEAKAEAERLLAEEKLLLENKRMMTILQSSSEAIFGLDAQGTCTFINDAAVRLLGYKREEYIGKNTHELLHYKHRDGMPYPLTECPVYKAFLQGKSSRITKEILWRKDGSALETLYSCTPIIEKGKVVGGVVNIVDLSERERIERQREQFLGVASHELKTPVTSLKAYAQVLYRRFMKEENMKAAELLGKMDAQLNKLTVLIADLLDVTRLESGKLLFHQDFLDLNEVLQETVEEVQRTTQQHAIKLRMGKSKTLFGDRERIGQVVTNLLTNAIKYSPDAKEIIVTTILDKKEVTVSVKDFGIGIPAQQQTYVFDRFFRVMGKKQMTYPGLGLGLFISSEIVKRHGGKIWVESKEGKGTTFFFTLPTASPVKRERHRGGREEGATKVA